MNGTRTRGTALAFVGVLVGVLLGGCGGGDGDATPTFSPSPTPTVQPTSASPVETSSSTSATAETPEAFVKRWNDASTVMQNSGDTTEFTKISADCEACAGVAGTVRKYYAAGGYVKTAGWRIISTSCKTVAPSHAECVAKVVNDVTRYKEASAAPEKTLPGGKFSEFFRLSDASGTWNMTYIAEQAT